MKTIYMILFMWSTLFTGAGTIILRMINNGNGGLGNDLAIDDISFRRSQNNNICTGVEFSEDFGVGTTPVASPFSNYVFSPIVGNIGGGEYAIVNDPLIFWWHQGAVDNTPADVNGRAFYVNGDDVIGEFYRRSLTLQANTDYNFNSLFVTTYYNDSNIYLNNGYSSGLKIMQAI